MSTKIETEFKIGDNMYFITTSRQLVDTVCEVCHGRSKIAEGDVTYICEACKGHKTKPKSKIVYTTRVRQIDSMLLYDDEELQLRYYDNAGYKEKPESECFRNKESCEKRVQYLNSKERNK